MAQRNENYHGQPGKSHIEFETRSTRFEERKQMFEREAKQV